MLQELAPDPPLIHPSCPLVQIKFQPVPEATIEALIEEGEIFWCAGGLMAEHPLVAPHILGMEGGMDAVMGLDRRQTMTLLEELFSI